VAAENWSTHQLTEFLACVSASEDERAAIRNAVERAIEALEADTGAVLRGDGVLAAVGFPRGAAPAAELAEVVDGRRSSIEVPGLGSCAAVSAPLDCEGGGALILARSGDDPFDREDLNLMRGMTRVLTLTLRLLRVVGAERALRTASEQQAAENTQLLASLADRRRLIDQLVRLQECITERPQLDQVLNMIVDGATALAAADAATLCLSDPDDPAELILAASRGLTPKLERRLRRIPISEGAAGLAMREQAPVVVSDYGARADMVPEMAREAAITSTFSLPLREHGVIIGALVVGRRGETAPLDASQRSLLVTFVEQASVALAAARTADNMRQAFRDPLTGLPNRALLLSRMELALARGEREQRPVTVLFIDLDRFKLVNDSLGHAAGDRLLIDVSRRLRDCLGPHDTAARLGGDEFAVLLSSAGGAGVGEQVAIRILAALEPPFEVLGREVFVGASVGIAAGLDEPEELLRSADLAMYSAKRGPASFKCFQPAMRAAAVARLELEADLRRALDRGELLLHYQPVVELEGGRLEGVEALVRWRHPTRGMIAPSEFVPLAEETGLVLRLGRFVLHEACRQAAAWRAAYGGSAPSWVSVNLSGRHLLEPSLVDDVRAALAASTLEPHRLMLEITETVLVEDVERAIEQLHALRTLGVRVAIDDFGTGYSSLRYVARFPADVLKIAKPFVDTIEHDHDAALVDAIVTLARNLELDLIAEGIERQGQWARLARRGCPLGQGYLFARPVEAAELEPLLVQRLAA
jgi:diguanylate cyclase (GGDEF)-like protein